jgi:hypothetical protein
MIGDLRGGWLPRGLEFLSGLPVSARLRRWIVPVQVFADESISNGKSGYFVMAALMAEAAAWAEFTDEWDAALSCPPAIRYFKMKEAAGCTDQFNYFSALERDQKLRMLAAIINRYVKLYTYSIIDLTAFYSVWKNKFSLARNPYFFPFHDTIISSARSLYDLGHRERFEMVFDEHWILGPRARVWYPVIREIVRVNNPAIFSILPVDPIFRSDDEFRQLQAVDMFAWCARREAGGDADTFSWLLPEFKDITRSDYAGLYDAEKMRNIMELSSRLRIENKDNENDLDMLDLAEKYEVLHDFIYNDK